MSTIRLPCEPFDSVSPPFIPLFPESCILSSHVRGVVRPSGSKFRRRKSK
ncbi:hypothetical protein HMPREF0239_01772 [Clostridium sp. ATCC BAA-442]|nr:hypothetical protein HMPREF0239_01772 [Clostridium sp. ATCC BAA-442]